MPLCDDITQMPGLGQSPAAPNNDIDETGRTVGLFQYQRSSEDDACQKAPQ